MGSKSSSAVLVLLVLVASLMEAEAQLGLISGILGLIHIQGILYCTANGNINLNGTQTPVFPNALVQLKCGSNVVASSTTSQSGLFSIVLDPLEYLLTSLLTGCKLVVNTPLSSCNINLSNVDSMLVSPLTFVSSSLAGALQIINVVAVGFQAVLST